MSRYKIATKTDKLRHLIAKEVFGEIEDSDGVRDIPSWEIFEKCLEQHKQIQALEHRLSNCIEPKFEYGQQVFYIANGYILSKWFYECESKDGIIISRYLHSPGEMVYRRKPKNLVFATEAEANAKLEEMKNG